MNKSQSKELINSDVVKDFIDICPHCGSKAHLEMLFNESYKERNRDLIYYVIFKCVPCKKLILETYRFKQNKFAEEENLTIDGWQDKFPTEDIIFIKKFEDIVPDDVLSDFKEGIISLSNKCFKAAIGMFRRSLQSAMIDLGADKKDDLIDQIKKLESITKDIKDWAHNIRIFGNWGVHPQDDKLKDIDFEKVEEAQDFLEEFFNYVYIMPSRVMKARKIEQKNNKTTDHDINDVKD